MTLALGHKNTAMPMTAGQPYNTVEESALRIQMGHRSLSWWRGDMVSTGLQGPKVLRVKKSQSAPGLREQMEAVP